MERKEALELLRKYNKEPFHILHGLTVEGTMRYFARENGEDEEYWGIIGLLHDVDFEMYPEEHCKKCIDILKENNLPEDMIYSICSHAYGSCSDVEPVKYMEKILYAIDELTGLIGAAIKMRPSKSTKDLEVSSLKKKFKDKKFAAGCSRDVIKQGAENLGWELDELFEKTILAMRDCEDKINEEMSQLF
jgi:predicted hydrolase (HD superfamily)